MPKLSKNCTASQELKLLENQWTAVKRAEERKTCKRQESDRNGHRFGAGLGGSDAFVSRIIHVAFRSPLDLGTRGGSVALHLAGSSQLVHGAGRRCGGFIPRIHGGHLCMMRCWSGEVSRLIPVEDKDESRFGQMFVVGLRPHLSEDEYVKFRARLDEAQIKIVANEKTMEDFHAVRDFEETDWSPVKISDDEATTAMEEDSENEDEEDEVQSKEHAVTPFDVQSTSPSGDQSGDPAVSLMDG
uniref:Uncharacterized protein n=1 Tax=Fagus sylvatica TaxID=28930 RepID=A0A2N9FRB9_FAGSY